MITANAIPIVFHILLLCTIFVLPSARQYVLVALHKHSVFLQLFAHHYLPLLQ